MSEISREDALAHFGVKGMKWGVRKAEESALSGYDIREARRNVSKEKRKMLGQRVKNTVTRDQEKKAKGKATLAEMKAAHLRNPDRATALRMTTGEKVVTALFLAQQATNRDLTPQARAVALATSAAGISYQVGKRKSIEREQQRLASS